MGCITVDWRTNVHRSIRPDTVSAQSLVDAAAGGKGRGDRNRNEKKEALPVHGSRRTQKAERENTEWRKVSVPVSVAVAGAGCQCRSSIRVSIAREAF